MKYALIAGAAAFALVAPASQAATTKKVAHKKAHSSSSHSIEDAAWGPGGKKPVVARKPGAKGGGKLDPTVTLKSKPVGDPTVALKTPDKPPSTSALTDPVSTAADGSKPAEELEKQAQRQRDPKQALTSYNKLLETNPNYAYAGDVYVSMYQLAERSHADTLDKLKYAGMAAQKLEAGLSRGKVNPQQINQFKRLEEKLTNEWITNEIAKIRAGKE